jgi:hypothetical protein
MSNCCSINCSVLLKEKHIDIPILNDSGKVILVIKNDTIKEDYYTVYIKKIKNDMAYVMAASIFFDTIPRFGWIDLKHLQILPAKYSSINLHKKPKKNSSIKTVIINPGYDNPINILNCKGNWLYVSFLDIDGFVKEGWMEPEDQCSDPYSMCSG